MGEWESTGRSDDWITPPAVFEALGERFDLDVASPPRATYVPADRLLSSHSLESEWNGFVWMNPPYGGRNGTDPWLAKFFDHGNGIALVADRTSAPWFWRAFPRAGLVMFTRKIRFYRPDGSLGVSPANGTALMAAGDRGYAALLRAARKGFGILAKTVDEYDPETEALL